METKDLLNPNLQSLHNIKAPEGFSQRLMARIETDELPQLRQPNFYSVSGALCMASAAVLLLVLNTPLVNLIPEIINLIGGIQL